MSDLKVKIEKLVGSSNWSKWKWQMNMHFEQYDMVSIIDGTSKILVPVNAEQPTEEEKKSIVEWKR